MAEVAANLTNIQKLALVLVERGSFEINNSKTWTLIGTLESDCTQINILGLRIFSSVIDKHKLQQLMHSFEANYQFHDHKV